MTAEKLIAETVCEPPKILKASYFLDLPMPVPRGFLLLLNNGTLENG